MASTIEDPWGESPARRYSAAAKHRQVVELEEILAALLSRSERDLPEWSYRRWCWALSYPDASERAWAATRELGAERDAVLADPVVGALLEWAGSIRRDDPVTAVAAALAVIGELRFEMRGAAPCAEEAANAVVTAVATARPFRCVRRRSTYLVADADCFADRAGDDADAARDLARSDARVARAVDELLACIGLEIACSLRRRIDSAVIQAGLWWMTHAVPIPTAIEGPRLPGVVLARDLRGEERLSAAISDTALLGLVAGPQPGRGRSSQAAWRRGLTFWVAARLAPTGRDRDRVAVGPDDQRRDLDAGPVGDAVDRPAIEAVRWWQSELVALARRPYREAVVPARHAGSSLSHSVVASAS